MAGGVALLAGWCFTCRPRAAWRFDAFDVANMTPATWLILIGFVLERGGAAAARLASRRLRRSHLQWVGVPLRLYHQNGGLPLCRGFPGLEILVPLGVVMALYGVVYAVLENDCRRLLAYHIISQVGYMVAGVGIGTEMAINGACAHAFANILYKGLLFMGCGAVLT
jgi:multicomponent Na+:H+ antiporter subunit D